MKNTRQSLSPAPHSTETGNPSFLRSGAVASMLRMPVATLRRVLAYGLIIVGLWYGWQTLKEAFA